MSRWYRHYAGLCRDEKLVRVAIKSRQPVERVVWVWCAILESAAEIDDNGRYCVDAAEFAYFLRADEADISGVLVSLADAGRIAENRVVNWSRRQFSSDRSKERVAAYRERKRSQDVRSDDVAPSQPDDVTLQKRYGNSPETETDTEIEVQEDKSSFTLSAPASPSLGVVVEMPTSKAEARPAKPARPHKSAAIEYPDAFSLLWDCYPRVPNQSKAEAFKSWQRLGDRDRMDLLSSVGPYEAFLEKERRRRPDYPACHLVTFINQRRWESLLEAS